MFIHHKAKGFLRLLSFSLVLYSSSSLNPSLYYFFFCLFCSLGRWLLFVSFTVLLETLLHFSSWHWSLSGVDCAGSPKLFWFKRERNWRLLLIERFFKIWNSFFSPSFVSAYYMLLIYHWIKWLSFSVLNFPAISGLMKPLMECCWHMMLVRSQKMQRFFPAFILILLLG